jgi:hypothetical protein
MTYTGVYRFARGDGSQPQHVLDGFAPGVVTLGNAAFIAAQAGGRDQFGTLYIDAPGSNGSFITRSLGSYDMRLTLQLVESDDQLSASVVRIGDSVAVADGQMIRLYDELGRVELTAKVTCNNVLPAATRDVLYALCTQQQGMPMMLAAFRR